MDEDPGKASPDRGLEGWNLRWRQGALRCRRAAGNRHGGGPSGWWDASRPGPPGERRARAAATAGPGGADGPAPGHPVDDDRCSRRDRRRTGEGEGEGAEHAAFHAADPAGQRDEPPGQLPAASANSRPRQGTDSRPARNRQPAPPRRRAGSSRCTPPPRPPSRARRAGMTTRQGLRPARRSCASGGDGGLASGRVCRRGGTADPGPGPPRVPEHPREGPLPRRRAETRQARPGQAARVEEPSPGAPSRRGKNDEERAHPQARRERAG